MKKFVLNTNVSNMGSQACIYDLEEDLRSSGYETALNNWNEYANYDVAVFMGVDPDIETARQQNSKIKIVIADPKQSSQDYIDTARQADLLMVSSVEQREAFRRLNSNIIIYPMFPRIPESIKEHRQKPEIVIGYHGNKVHLEGMGHHVSPALEALAKTHKIKLVLVYNLENLGKCQKGLPDPEKVKTEHIQWHEGIYDEVMPEIDIGIVPNLLPISNLQETLRISEVANLNVNYEPFDFMTRYKASSNSGRIAVFGKYGIPVVTDFTPSACQMITDGVDSYLAGTPHGWYCALDNLLRSSEKRQVMGENLASTTQRLQENVFKDFLTTLNDLSQAKPVQLEGVPQAEDDLKYFVPPPQASLTTRILRRLQSVFSN